MGEAGRESTPARLQGQRGDMRRLIFLCALFILGAGSAFADDYPSHPIRLIVPFAPGGAVDPIARLIANPLGERLGKPIVIYDRGGAGGSIGMDEVAKSPPDGYTLLLDHSGMTYMPGLYRTLPFDPVKDFDGIITAVAGFYVLAVNNDLPVKSVAELIAYAKANPGKLSYGSAGIGSTLHLAGELFKRAAGIDIVHVPYKGAAPAATDLAGGQIPMMFGPATALLPLAQAGKIRALAVTSAKRSALAPELADHDGNAAGFRSRRLVRPRRAGRHAEGCDRKTQRRNQRRAAIARPGRENARAEL